MSIPSKNRCCFGAGIFLLGALCAQAAQDGTSSSTRTAAQAQRTTAQEAADHPELHRRNPRYQLGIDDVLQLTFPLTPEFNQTLTIQPDGFITLQGVGDLHVAGQTVPEVQAVEVAGGFTESSKHSQVWLFRRVSNDWVETQRFDVKKMLKTGDLREDALLRPGDMLYVPKNTLSKIKRFIPVATMGLYFNPLM